MSKGQIYVFPSVSELGIVGFFISKGDDVIYN